MVRTQQPQQEESGSESSCGSLTPSEDEESYQPPPSSSSSDPAKRTLTKSPDRSPVRMDGPPAKRPSGTEQRPAESDEEVPATKLKEKNKVMQELFGGEISTDSDEVTDPDPVIAQTTNVLRNGVAFL